jgi:hypothetical protein
MKNKEKKRKGLRVSLYLIVLPTPGRKNGNVSRNKTDTHHNSSILTPEVLGPLSFV